MDAEPLGDLPCGVELQHVTGDFGPLTPALIGIVVVGLLVIPRVVCVGVRNAAVAVGPGLPAAATQGPEPHSRKPGVGLQASGISILEDHRQGLGRDGRPDVL